MRIKNKDIADQLGISTTAVSLAINNKPGVSEETRMKVLKLLNGNSDLPTEEGTDSGSVPVTARAILLSVHKKNGMIIDDKPFFSGLIETIQQEAMLNSCILNIAHVLPDQDMNEYIHYLAQVPVDGVIVLGTEMTEEDYVYYRDLSVPVVLLDTAFPLSYADAVVIDNEASIMRAFRYAVENGHKNIGYLQSSFWISNFQQRYEGFLKAIRMYQLEDYDHPVLPLPCTMEGACAKMKEFLKAPPEDFHMPTLFLADLDYIAIGAMQALKEEGYRIPEDVSIIGYDDLAICIATEPGLTSTKVNQAALGRQAVRKLMERISCPDTDYSTVTEVSSRLIIRESVYNLSNAK